MTAPSLLFARDQKEPGPHVADDGLLRLGREAPPVPADRHLADDRRPGVEALDPGPIAVNRLELVGRVISAPTVVPWQAALAMPAARAAAALAGGGAVMFLV